MRNISEITASLINKFFFTVGFKIINKIDKIVKVQKDKIEYTQKNNVVYQFKINCKNCEVIYVYDKRKYN